MIRCTLALGVILMFSVPVCAQQSHPTKPQKPQKTSSGQIPDRNVHGHAKEIPAWNIHGHAEEIPSLVPSIEVTTSSSSTPPPCVIIAKHGKKYDVVEAFGPPIERFKKHLSERDLKKFRARGGSVEPLPSRYTNADIQSARSACTQAQFPHSR